MGNPHDHLNLAFCEKFRLHHQQQLRVQAHGLLCGPVANRYDGHDVCHLMPAILVLTDLGSMPKIDGAKVNDAIRECLHHCYEMPGAILPRIAEFLENLKSTGNWNAWELKEVEARVRKVLIFGILDGAVYSGDATNNPGGNVAPGGSKSPKVSGA